jgi:hypothetical protein
MMERGCLVETKGARVTLEEAVAILNERKHHGHSGWYISGGLNDQRVIFGIGQYEFFEPFEVAEKYVRESEPISERSLQD